MIDIADTHAYVHINMHMHISIAQTHMRMYTHTHIHAIQVRDLWEEYYAGADGIVFMIDSADTQRFAEAKEELNNLLKHESMQDTPVLLLGNKDDLQVCMYVMCVHVCVA
jgi:GTPase SAR1 family protein